VPTPTSTPPARLGRPPADLLQAEPWPEADALFRSDPTWLGSDGAYSVDLGDGLVLWLFADTFISTSDRHVRREAALIRNSIAIQSGLDPSTASIAFHWRTRGGMPASFFAEQGGTWFWPGHGIVVGDRLLIFLMAVRSSSGGLGFENVGWRAVSVSNHGRSPSEWELEWLHTPENRFDLIVSGSVLQMEGYLWAFSVQEPSHTVHSSDFAELVAREDLYYPRFLRASFANPK
jgi:hypothetical protein